MLKHKISYIKTKKDYNNLCNNQQGGYDKQNMLYALMVIILFGISLFAFGKRQGYRQILISRGEDMLNEVSATSAKRCVSHQSLKELKEEVEAEEAEEAKRKEAERKAQAEEV